MMTPIMALLYWFGAVIYAGLGVYNLTIIVRRTKSDKELKQAQDRYIEELGYHTAHLRDIRLKCGPRMPVA